MPSSRSAKEICREDPDSISCKVATKREARRKRRAEEYGEDKPPSPPPPPPEDKETKAPKPATDRLAYLDELEKQAGSKE